MPVKSQVELRDSGSSEESFGSLQAELFTRVESQFLGTVIENTYLIEKMIGKGSSSIVFAATDIKSLKKVAVKVLVRSIDSAGKRIDRFNQETRTTRYLRHNNILEIYSYGVEKGHAYFVMEYLTGGTLFDLLVERGKLKQAEAVAIINQVASALAFAHKEGVVHRDIKPGNILFTDKSRKTVKLVDFGMSTRLSWDYSDDVFRTPNGAIYGTTLYISPEQSKGEKTDQKTDVYSLGCVFYECLTGMPPHTGKTVIDVVMKHQKSEIIPVNQAAMTEVASKEIEIIVDKMLRKSLKDRYQNFEAILRDLSLVDRNKFDYKLYLRPEKEKLPEKRVKDYSNSVFIFFFVLAFIMMILTTIWISARPETPETKAPFLEGRTVLDTTNDLDLKQIRQCTNAMFYKVALPLVDAERIMKYYTKRWAENDYELLVSTWDNKQIEYAYTPADPVGKLHLETIDKLKGTASIIVDTDPWIESGPKSMRLRFQKVGDTWLIDEVQALKE